MTINEIEAERQAEIELRQIYKYYLTVCEEKDCYERMSITTGRLAESIEEAMFFYSIKEMGKADPCILSPEVQAVL